MPRMVYATIVIPCYNEEHRLRLTDFAAFLESNRAVRFIFVNDGSTDDTRNLLKQFAAEHADRVELPEGGKGRMHGGFGKGFMMKLR